MGGAAVSRQTILSVDPDPAIEHAPMMEVITSSRKSSTASEIDVDIVFSALSKLVCVFEIKESLMTSLTDEIVDPKHVNYEAQFVAVENWIQKHGGSMEKTLTPEEINYLIKYVELHRPAPVVDDIC